MWKCSKCNEEIEDDFDVCWNCETGRDGSSLASMSPDILIDKAQTKPLTILAKLGHFASTTKDYSHLGTKVGPEEWVETYRVYPVTLKRPENGDIITSITCSFCGEQIPIKIASGATVVKKRMLRLAVVAILLIYMYLVYTKVSPGRITTLEGLMVTAAVFAIFAVLINLGNAFKSEVELALTILEDGKRHRVFDPSK